MKLTQIFKRAAAPFSTLVDPSQLYRATILQKEELSRQYARDPEQTELVKRAQNIAHICAMINANACAAQPLRLYRRDKAGVSNASRKVRAVPKRVKRAWSGGTMGTKAMSFVESGADVVEIMDHPALDYMRNPNPLYPGSVLNVMLFYFWGITGNWYDITTEDEDGFMRWPGYPQYVMPRWSRENFLTGYYYGRASEAVVELSTDQVVHFKNNLSRTNPLMGEGDLAAVLPDIDLLVDISLFDLATSKNAQMPPAMVSMESDRPATRDQMQEIEKYLDTWARNGRREGKPFIGHKLKFQPLAHKPSELKTIEQMSAYEKRIMFAFGIPATMMDSSDVNFASANVADAQHGRRIRAKLVNHADQLNAHVLPMFGLDPADWCFVYDDPVPRDEQAEQTRLTALSNNAVLSINEVRAEMGYKQVDDENADALLFQGRPLGAQDAAQDPFAGLFSRQPDRQPEAPEKPEDDEETPEDGDGPEPDDDPDDTPTGGEKAAKPPVDLKAIRDAAMLKESPEWAAGAACPACKSVDEFPDDSIEAAIWRDEGSAFEGDIEAILSEVQAEDLRAYFDGEVPDVASMREQAEKLIREEVERVASRAIASEFERIPASLRDAFSGVDQFALDFSRTYSIRLADDIFGTTANIAQEAVARGIEEGLSIREIQNAMEGVPKYRAEMIARTEISRAANESRYELAGEIGGETSEWITSPGHSVAHGIIAARSPKPIGEPYVTAGEQIDTERFTRDIFAPPARPNCRCTLIYNYPESDE